MASILLIGRDAALLEGLMQSLAGAGHSSRAAHSAAEGVEQAATHPPLVVLAERRLAQSEPELLRAPLASGGALLLYHADDAEPGSLSAPLQRLVLADLALPLERHRLLALVQRVDERAQATGRRHPTPPEHRAY